MSAQAGPARWRAMRIDDLDGVVRVARASFPDHFEDRACFGERLALYPRGCFVLDAGAADAKAVDVAGYLIAYPWRSGSAPPLDSLIGALPADANLLYLHDLALRQDMRGRGFTKAIVNRLVTQARADRWPAIALVAVNRAAGFWVNAGFEIVHDEVVDKKLATYGAGAQYMVRKIGG
jgi:GNAT superfamily N-acetyltransferase